VHTKLRLLEVREPGASALCSMHCWAHAAWARDSLCWLACGLDFTFCRTALAADCYVVAGGLMSRDEHGFVVCKPDANGISGECATSTTSQSALAVYRFACDVLNIVRAVPA
jgi:hypothetical protein